MKLIIGWTVATWAAVGVVVSAGMHVFSWAGAFAVVDRHRFVLPLVLGMFAVMVLAIFLANSLMSRIAPERMWEEFSRTLRSGAPKDVFWTLVLRGAPRWMRRTLLGVSVYGGILLGVTLVWVWVSGEQRPLGGEGLLLSAVILFFYLIALAIAASFLGVMTGGACQERPKGPDGTSQGAPGP